MRRDPSASTVTMVGRASRRRCPRCGAKAFDSYFQLLEHCDRCGLRFEREPGYWVGALIINTTVVFGAFLLVFIGGMALTWPDVPWVNLGALTIATMAILPVVFYPISRTLWMALELSWHPLEDHEIAEAEAVIGNRQ
ncbi:MAG TPA: DUF983 domain-containing protein [Acidimicrobiia bacterium]|nr:DUF983 domain-containing protein [Acidimicrobiia bacterium]